MRTTGSDRGLHLTSGQEPEPKTGEWAEKPSNEGGGHLDGGNRVWHRVDSVELVRQSRRPQPRFASVSDRSRPAGGKVKQEPDDDNRVAQSQFNIMESSLFGCEFPPENKVDEDRRGASLVHRRKLDASGASCKGRGGGRGTELASPGEGLRSRNDQRGTKS